MTVKQRFIYLCLLQSELKPFEIDFWPHSCSEIRMSFDRGDEERGMERVSDFFLLHLLLSSSEASVNPPRVIGLFGTLCNTIKCNCSPSCSTSFHHQPTLFESVGRRPRGLTKPGGYQSIFRQFIEAIPICYSMNDVCYLCLWSSQEVLSFRSRLV